MDDLIKRAEEQTEFNAMAKSLGWSTNNEIITALLEKIKNHPHSVGEWHNAADIARIAELDQQIAHKQEQCDQLAHQVLELEQQLADERKAAGYWMEQSCKDHNRAEKAEQQLAALKQVSAELCDKCGWAMKFPGEECCKCKSERLEQELERIAEGESSRGYMINIARKALGRG